MVNINLYCLHTAYYVQNLGQQTIKSVRIVYSVSRPVSFAVVDELFLGFQMSFFPPVRFSFLH